MATYSVSRRVAAEFLGTAVLLVAVVGSSTMAEKLSGGNVGLALLCNSIATGAALFVLITIFGPISGAHFNPVVSGVMWARGSIYGAISDRYIAAQVAGGLTGVLAAHLIFDQSLLEVSATSRNGLGQWSAEAIATFGLIMTIIGTVKFAPDKVASAVGLYILSAGLFTSSTSFANPVVTVARAFTNSFASIALADVAALIAAQCLGAVAAHYTGRWLFGGEDGKS